MMSMVDDDDELAGPGMNTLPPLIKDTMKGNLLPPDTLLAQLPGILWLSGFVMYNSQCCFHDFFDKSIRGNPDNDTKPKWMPNNFSRPLNLELG